MVFKMGLWALHWWPPEPERALPETPPADGTGAIGSARHSVGLRRCLRGLGY